jgi:hypothetical protein
MNLKMLILFFVRLPGDIHLGHLRSRWTSVAPADDLLDLLLLPFEHGLNRPVGSVHDPSADTNPVGLILRALAKPDTLDKSVNDHPCAKILHTVKLQ